MTEEDLKTAERTLSAIKSLKNFIQSCDEYIEQKATVEETGDPPFNVPVMDFSSLFIPDDTYNTVSKLSFENLLSTESAGSYTNPENIMLKHMHNALEELELNFKYM